MRVAVVSDIHSNLAALEAVLAAIDADAPDEVWCLGDLVGYGPRPNECTEAIAARATICLAGNHDLAVLGTIDLLEFSGEAGVAARWTREVLTGSARAFLEGSNRWERRTASRSSTRARATRSGSTSSPTRRPRPRSL